MTEKENETRTGQETVSGPEKISREELEIIASQVLRILHHRTTTRRFKAGKYDRHRLAYARATTAMVATYGALLKDAELEDLEKRIERLEQTKERE